MSSHSGSENSDESPSVHWKSLLGEEFKGIGELDSEDDISSFSSSDKIKELREGVGGVKVGARVYSCLGRWR